MPNMAILQANIAAALNKNNLSESDKNRLEEYAHRTASGYCAGCAGICEKTVDLDIPISDILRYSMYNHSYGDRKTALRLFNNLPAEVRANIFKADYSTAEKFCPQKIKIGKIIKRTCDELA